MNENLPAHAKLIQMGTAFWMSRAVYAAAKLSIADHIAQGAKDAEALSKLTGTHAPSLYRLLRTLGALGIVTENSSKEFSLTPLGEALKESAPGAARSSILALSGEWMWKGFDKFLYSLETGKASVPEALGMPVFEYFAKNPEEARYFNEAMIGFHGDEPPAVAAAYDFSLAATVVDIGGGTGNMLSAILKAHPNVKGILFDLPHVAKEAVPHLKEQGIEQRVKVEGGDFFEEVPSGGDLYILSHVIHDWNDEQSVSILKTCRKAMKPDSKILLVEMVLPAGDVFHPGKLLDMVMLVAPGGKERSEEEYSELLAAAGFQLSRVIPTQSAVSVVEGVVV